MEDTEKKVAYLQVPVPSLEKAINDGYLVLMCSDSPDGECYDDFLEAMKEAGRVAIVCIIYQCDMEDLVFDPVTAKVSFPDENLMRITSWAPPGRQFPTDDESRDRILESLRGNCPAYCLDYIFLEEGAFAFEPEHAGIHETCRWAVENVPAYLAPEKPGPISGWDTPSVN